MLALHRTIQRINKGLPATSHWHILLASVPVALATGTLFVYSVYGTQLAERCHLDSSQAANLNVAATIGTAFGGMLGGLATDAYGTQIPILGTLLTVPTGYRWLYELYMIGESASRIQLLSAMFLVGFGSVAGYFSTIKAVALSFPEYKGSAQSVTIASFAISSLINLLVASKVYEGDVGEFLYFLHILSMVMLLVGFIFVRIEGYVDAETEPLLAQQEGGLAVLLLASESEVLLVSESAKREFEPHSLKHLSLKQSLAHPVFWVHYAVLAVIQGLGQMYIYSVGSIVQALHYRYQILHPEEQIPPLHEFQAVHVLLIAVASFAGRLASGPQSDFIVRKGAQRHWILVVALVFLLVGHLLLNVKIDRIFSTMESINIVLLVVSCFIGYAYGFGFACYPAIIADLFAMKNYSFIWGFLYTATSLGLTVMTKLFGHIYDSNRKFWDGKDYVCDKGAACYRDTFGYTSELAVVAIGAVLGYIWWIRRSSQ